MYTLLTTMTTLAQLIHHGPLAYDRFLDLAIQITGKVRAFHEHGLPFLKVCPDTILIDENNQALLADIAASDQDYRERLLYYSPERLSGGNFDIRSDLFSLGAVFYEMLTGHVPFAGNDRESLLDSISKGLPESNLLTRDDIDTEARLVIAKLLEPSPADRFTSAEELLATLREMQADSHRPSAPVEPRKKEHSARTYLMLAILTLLLLIFWWVITTVNR
jgi:serine/threonine protein kinase